jgi:hypothetical protein
MFKCCWVSIIKSQYKSFWCFKTKSRLIHRLSCHWQVVCIAAISLCNDPIAAQAAIILASGVSISGMIQPTNSQIVKITWLLVQPKLGCLTLHQKTSLICFPHHLNFVVSRFISNPHNALSPSSPFVHLTPALLFILFTLQELQPSQHCGASPLPQPHLCFFACLFLLSLSIILNKPSDCPQISCRAIRIVQRRPIGLAIVAVVRRKPIATMVLPTWKKTTPSMTTNTT